MDRLDEGSKAAEDYNALVRQSTFNKKVYGVFGYIKLASYGHLILIEEASLVGQIMKANVYKVQKLMFLPFKNDSSRMVAPEDQTFVDMI